MFNQDYSTTKNLVNEKPIIENNKDDKFDTVLFLPKNKERIYEGGLRTKGYFKKSFENKPLISIVTVVYNGEKYLEQTIKSVVEQSYDNVEYILIDGGSSDRSLEIIKKYEHCIDYIISEKDDGIYDAMNKGIGLASGQWINFLGSDDILYNVLYKVAKKLDLKKDAIYGDVYMPSRHILYCGKFTKLKLLFNNICHQSIFYNKKIFTKRNYNLRYKILADYVFNLLVYDENKFSYIPILIAQYNDFSGVSSTTIDKSFQQDQIKIIKNNFTYKYYFYFRSRKLIVATLTILKLKFIVKRILNLKFII